MDVGGGDKKLMSEINVTPLVDVMLVLLIIFMVAAPMMMQGMDVQLPQTKSKAISSREERLVVSLNKNQEIFINEYRVSRSELQEKLKILIPEQKGRRGFFAGRPIPSLRFCHSNYERYKKCRNRKIGYGNRTG